MSTTTLNLDDDLYHYFQSVAFRELPVLAELRAQTQQMEHSNMQIAPEQGAFMAMLVKLTGARRIIEIGTFTGYSALSMALALPEGGELLALDINQDWTAVAQKYWRQAGVADKITLHIAPAQETLNSLLTNGESAQFDLMFIDADKTGYDGYYELGLKLLRPGGIMLFDNVLWGGAVADSEAQDADSVALRELNAKLHADERIDLSMIPIADGLTLARKR